MKILYLTALLAAALSCDVMAQDTSIFPKGEVSTVNNHTGIVWLNELVSADSIFTYSVAVATFAPEAKLDWHIHPAGQVLLITEGTGYYQERGKPIQVVRKGDVIKCAPGVEHWHGALPENSFTYIAMTPAQKGKTIWLKRVTDAEYGGAQAQEVKAPTAEEQQVIDLSKQKWRWMADKNADSLNVLFDTKAVFVHMGGSWGKSNELDVIKSGNIWYKQAQVYSASVNLFGNTAILLNDIDLVAVVGGKEVTNPFMVTEVYIKEDGKWRMGSLTFSHLLRPVKLNNSNNNQQH